MSPTYQSPPVSPETATHLVRLFCMGNPYRLAYMAALQLLHPDDPHWQDIVTEVSLREERLSGKPRTDRATRPGPTYSITLRGSTIRDGGTRRSAI